MINNVSGSYGQYLQASGTLIASANTLNTTKIYPETTSQEIQKSNDTSTKVTISDEALIKLGLSKESQTSDNTKSTSDYSKLTAEEIAQIEELETRDQEVRAHELAHVMAGGNLVRKGASYQYQTGPNGQRYAIAGEVSIDSSLVDGDPTATITKMQQVKRAALAPAEPSGQDRAVAVSATQTEAAARLELLQQSAETQ